MFINRIEDSFELTPGFMIRIVNTSFFLETLINFNMGYCEESKQIYLNIKMYKNYIF